MAETSSNKWFEKQRQTVLKYIHTELSIVDNALNSTDYPPNEGRKRFLESQKYRLTEILEFVNDCNA